MENVVLFAAIIGGLVGLLVTIPLIIKQRAINKGGSKAASGERFSQVVAFSGNRSEMEDKLIEFLLLSGFKPQTYGDEKVYRKGEGMMTACQMLKYTFVPEGILLEAFVILFGAKESGLTGFTGIIVKKPLKETVIRIIKLIESN